MRDARNGIRDQRFGTRNTRSVTHMSYRKPITFFFSIAYRASCIPNLVSRISYLASLAILFALCTPSIAHESRPAYLEINETVPGRYDVLWRTPLNAGMRLLVLLRFPEQYYEPSVR